MGNNWKTTRRQGSNVLDPKIGGQSGRHRETTGRHRGVQGRLSGRHTVGEKQWEIRGHSGRQGGGHRQTGTHSGRDSVGDKGDTVGGTERERHSGRHKGRHSGKQCSKVPGIYTSSQTGRQMNWRHPDSRTPPPRKSRTPLKKELRTPTVNCVGKKHHQPNHHPGWNTNKEKHRKSRTQSAKLGDKCIARPETHELETSGEPVQTERQMNC